MGKMKEIQFGEYQDIEIIIRHVGSKAYKYFVINNYFDRTRMELEIKELKPLIEALQKLDERLE